jgi:hypothetical protein
MDIILAGRRWTAAPRFGWVSTKDIDGHVLTMKLCRGFFTGTCNDRLIVACARAVQHFWPMAYNAMRPKPVEGAQ